MFDSQPLTTGGRTNDTKIDRGRHSRRLKRSRADKVIALVEHEAALRCKEKDEKIQALLTETQALLLENQKLQMLVTQASLTVDIAYDKKNIGNWSNIGDRKEVDKQDLVGRYYIRSTGLRRVVLNKGDWYVCLS
jgi:tRNA G10  N-methylase Trm11